VTTEPISLSLCKLSDIAIGSARGFSVVLPGDKTKQDIFVVRTQQGIFVYKNQCPHTLVNLNWQSDQFFNYDKNYIQCAMHGALFQFHDGFCIWGPCKGQSLQKVDARVENEYIVLS